MPSPAKASLESVDHALFEKLRKLRRELAREGGVPAYIVYGDVTLRDLARERPSSPSALLDVSGIGMKKLEQYGERILETIRRHFTGKQRK